MDWCQEPAVPPCLTRGTIGRCRPPKRQPPSKAHRLQQIPEDKPMPLVEEEEPTEKKKRVEDEFVMNRSMSTSRSPRSLPKKELENDLFRPSSVRKVNTSRPPSFLAELSRAQSRRNPDFLAELNKAQRNINPAPIAIKSPTFHAELSRVCGPGQDSDNTILSRNTTKTKQDGNDAMFRGALKKRDNIVKKEESGGGGG